MNKKAISAILASIMALLLMCSCDGGSSGSTKTKSDNNNGYKSFMNDVDKAGDGNGKASWDDWNNYADKNGYNRAY